MRALALHPDVLLVTSALLQVNCVIVRGRVGDQGAETFVIDSPVLPDELDALPALIEQGGFPAPSGLLATHGDWDHLLGRLAFPGVALGVAQSTAERLGAAPGEAQRQLRSFDEELLIERPRPLALGSVQTLPVPGRCEVGDRELELHPTDGHTVDGMAVLLPWAGILIVGDYLSSVELPSFGQNELDTYCATLERLRVLIDRVEHVVPGHGPGLIQARALTVLEQDIAYLHMLAEGEFNAGLPVGRNSASHRRAHAENVRHAS